MRRIRSKRESILISLALFRNKKVDALMRGEVVEVSIPNRPGKSGLKRMKVEMDKFDDRILRVEEAT